MYMVAMVVIHGCHGGYTWLPWWLYMFAMVVIHGCHGGYTMFAMVVIHGCHGGSLFILPEFKKYFLLFSNPNSAIISM